MCWLIGMRLASSAEEPKNTLLAHPLSISNVKKAKIDFINMLYEWTIMLIYVDQIILYWFIRCDINQTKLPENSVIHGWIEPGGRRSPQRPIQRWVTRQMPADVGLALPCQWTRFTHSFSLWFFNQKRALGFPIVGIFKVFFFFRHLVLIDLYCWCVDWSECV